ncbi:MAG: hypothetical protein V1767_07615 [Chloroflexota bacterium]
MSKRLDKVKLVKGFKWERQDDLDNQGVPTYDLVKDAIKEGKTDIAKDLLDYLYFWEIKFVRDSNIDIVGGFPQFWMTRYGEEQLFDVYWELLCRQRGVASWPVPPVGLKHRQMTGFDYAMEHAIWMVRPHRMGRLDGTGGFVLEEYEDRYEVVWDPCYTGGRTRRGDPIASMPPHTAPPFNYATNKVPHPWTWGKTGVTGYCIHCTLLHELMDVAQTDGYLGQWVSGYPENPWDPCRYITYKNVDWIPEKYYTRLGKTKPKPKAPIPKFKDVTKPIKVTHSHELGPFWKVTDGEHWMNFVPRIKKALDEGKKAKALKLVDMLRAETALWHARYPIRWNWSWIDLVIERFGYDEVHYALRSLYSRMEPPLAPDEPKLTKDQIPSAEVRAKKAAAWGRGDLSGPNSEGSVKIIDEPDRIVMELNPCGSVGRNLLPMDKVDDLTAEIIKELVLPAGPAYSGPRGPLTEAPFNYKVTTKAHPIGWGKVGIPNLCTRCCVQFEMDAVARTGYLTTVIERPENATDPNCRWFFYKNLDDIPEKYYTRIGMKKPARQAKKK